MVIKFITRFNRLYAHMRNTLVKSCYVACAACAASSKDAIHLSACQVPANSGRSLKEAWKAIWGGMGGRIGSAALVLFSSSSSWVRMLVPDALKAPASMSSVEKKWTLKMLDEDRPQLANGEWDLTRNGAYRFSATGKKELAYALRSGPAFQSLRIRSADGIFWVEYC